MSDIAVEQANVSKETLDWEAVDKGDDPYADRMKNLSKVSDRPEIISDFLTKVWRYLDNDIRQHCLPEEYAALKEELKAEL